MLGLDAGAEDFLSKPVDRAELTRSRQEPAAAQGVRRLPRQVQPTPRGRGESHARPTSSRASVSTAPRSTPRPSGSCTSASTGGGCGSTSVSATLFGVLGAMSCVVLVPGDLLQSPGRDRARPRRSRSWPRVRSTATSSMRSHTDGRDGTFVWARVHLSVHRDAGGSSLSTSSSVIEDITDAEGARSAGPPGEQDGRDRATGRGRRPRLQQPPVGHPQLQRAARRWISSEGDPMRADFGEIKGAGLRAVALTRQLLAFSRQQVLQPQIVNLAEIVSGMEKMLQRLIGEDVELTTNAEVVPARSLVDPGQMEQVIMNLAVNARDAMPQGGKLTIETGERRPRRGLRLRARRRDARPARHAGRHRHGHRHGQGDAGPHVRALLHDQGGRERHGARARDGLRDRPAERRNDLGLQRARQGNDVQALLPRRSGAGALESPSPPVEIRRFAAPRPSSSSRTRSAFASSRARFSASTATTSSRPRAAATRSSCASSTPRPSIFSSRMS